MLLGLWDSKVSIQSTPAPGFTTGVCAHSHTQTHTLPLSHAWGS